MGSFNKVIIMGNLTRDPQVRYTPGGTAVADLGLALNNVWYDDNNQKHEEVDFVDVTVWGRKAEIAGEYLSKGRQVHVEGRLKLDQWDDRDTGQKRSKLKVVAQNITFTSGNQSGGQGSYDADDYYAQGGENNGDSNVDDFYEQPSTNNLNEDNSPF